MLDSDGVGTYSNIEAANPNSYSPDVDSNNPQR